MIDADTETIRNAATNKSDAQRISSHSTTNFHDQFDNSAGRIKCTISSTSLPQVNIVDSSYNTYK